LAEGKINAANPWSGTLWGFLKCREYRPFLKIACAQHLPVERAAKSDERLVALGSACEVDAKNVHVERRSAAERFFSCLLRLLRDFFQRPLIFLALYSVICWSPILHPRLFRRYRPAPGL
jgi:hypothetical protein